MNIENLEATQLLDYTSSSVIAFKNKALARTAKNPAAQLRALYLAITKLPLGYNRNDNIPASEVLRDGYGQCNTKTILLMALARSANIPSRVHAYNITKDVQRGRHYAWLVFFMPRTTVFFWPEFFVNGKWLPLEKLVHEKTKKWNSCPFDGARYSLTPVLEETVVEDHGVFASPDTFFEDHSPTVYGWRRIGFWLLGRSLMNKKLQRSTAC
jgi:hypothetical protein